MDANLESRVATLEERARAQSELNNHLSVKLDTIVSSLARLETSLALAGARSCPAPGKCLELQTTIDRLKEDSESTKADLEALKTTAAEARGGWKAIALIAGLAGTVGSVIGWLVSYLTGKGKL